MQALSSIASPHKSVYATSVGARLSSGRHLKNRLTRGLSQQQHNNIGLPEKFGMSLSKAAAAAKASIAGPWPAVSPAAPCSACLALSSQVVKTWQSMSCPDTSSGALSEDGRLPWPRVLNKAGRVMNCTDKVCICKREARQSLLQ